MKDTIEKIKQDAMMTDCEYFKKELDISCDGCAADYSESCVQEKVLDLIDRTIAVMQQKHDAVFDYKNFTYEQLPEYFEHESIFFFEKYLELRNAIENADDKNDAAKTAHMQYTRGVIAKTLAKTLSRTVKKEPDKKDAVLAKMTDLLNFELHKKIGMLERSKFSEIDIAGIEANIDYLEEQIQMISEDE